MSVKPRGKSYLIDVKVGKERVRQTLRVTRQEAKRIEAGIRQKLLSDRAPEHGLEEALLKYLEEYVPHLKDVRGQTNKAKHIRPHLVGRTFSEISIVVSEIRALPKAAATRNRRLALLRRLCSLAYKEWKWLDKPIHIGLLSENNQRHIYLTPKQLNQIIKHCKSQGAKDAIKLAAYTGFRRSELFKLDESSVQDGFLVLDASTKTGKPRVVPIHPDIQPIIKRLPLRTTDALLRIEWVNARKAANLSHVRFHDLRHTWASWLAQSGVSLFTIGEILGHSQAQTTRRYAHLGRDDLKAAVRQFRAQKGAQ